MNIKWEVYFTRAAKKQADKLEDDVLIRLLLLVEDITTSGPAAVSWPSYGKLHGRKNQDRRHCHLKNGKPTYVCCWEVVNVRDKIIEVYYVGTHEKAPY